MEVTTNFYAEEINGLDKHLLKLIIEKNNASKSNLSVDKIMNLQEVQQNPQIQEVLEKFKRDQTGDIKFKMFIDGITSQLANETDSCCVCLDERKNNQMITLKPCLHKICAECVKKLNSCPLCRSDIKGTEPKVDGQSLSIDIENVKNSEAPIVSSATTNDDCSHPTSLCCCLLLFVLIVPLLVSLLSKQSDGKVIFEQRNQASSPNLYNKIEVNNDWQNDYILKQMEEDRKRRQREHNRRFQNFMLITCKKEDKTESLPWLKPKTNGTTSDFLETILLHLGVEKQCKDLIENNKMPKGLEIF
jgi:hypothetical protein